MSMFKSIPVTYPKRRKKKEEFIINEVQEPVRKTMYDIAMDNFRALKRVSKSHFYIYEKADYKNTKKYVNFAIGCSYSALLSLRFDHFSV